MSDADAAEAVAVAESVFINNCCGYTALALLFYEYAITFDREVNMFWTRRFTGATALFLTNRYLPLLLQIVDMCGYAPMSNESCSVLVYIAQTVQVLQYLPWALFSALRAYALSGRTVVLGLIVFMLSSVPIGVNLTQYHWLEGFTDPMYGCTNILSIPDNLVHSLTIASRTCLISADVLVIIVTWTATYRMRRFSFTENLGGSFSAVLFEYGMIYFIILTILNALHLSFTLASLASDTISPVSYVTVFTEPITAILVSRFLFNLQEANQNSIDSTASISSRSYSLSHASSINFARVIGPLGSALTSRAPEDEDMLELSERAEAKSRVVGENEGGETRAEA